MNPFNLSGFKSEHARLPGGGAEFTASMTNRDAVVAQAAERVRNVAYMNGHLPGVEPIAEQPAPQPRYIAAAPQLEQPQGNVMTFPVPDMQGVSGGQPVAERPAGIEDTQTGEISAAEALARVYQVHDEEDLAA